MKAHAEESPVGFPRQPAAMVTGKEQVSGRFVEPSAVPRNYRAPYHFRLD